MKIRILTVVLLAVAGTFPTRSAYAQNPPPAPAATPAAVTAVTPSPDQVIYSPRLPTVAELSNVAAAQGLAVEKIEQTASGITAVYRLANGQTKVVAYQLLPTASPIASAPPPPVAVEAPPVVYAVPPRVVYAYDPFFYDPWYWYPPVSFHVGVGYGFRGGYHGHEGGHFRRR